MLVSLMATAVIAQQRPIFDPDDFVDPRQRQGSLFISRVIFGAAANFVDDYRPAHQGAGLIEVANSYYGKQTQFDYKHSEVRGEHGPADVFRCGCNPPIYFPTPAPPDATPAAPQPGPKDTFTFGWYHSVDAGPAEPRIMLRYRLTLSRQHIGTDVKSIGTQQDVEHRSGHEQSIGLDADTHFRIGTHDVWGSLVYATTSRSGTIDDRRQHELSYTSRFPGRAVGPLLVRATLTIGAISDRGGRTLNLINPAFEAFWHNNATQANVHLIYSPQTLDSGAEGWRTHHQIALFVDRALYVKLFR